MSRVKVQIRLPQETKSKLKILAEMQHQSFQDYTEGILTDMVSGVEINLSTNSNDKEGVTDNE